MIIDSSVGWVWQLVRVEIRLFRVVELFSSVEVFQIWLVRVMVQLVEVSMLEFFSNMLNSFFMLVISKLVVSNSRIILVIWKNCCQEKILLFSCSRQKVRKVSLKLIVFVSISDVVLVFCWFRLMLYRKMVVLLFLWVIVSIISMNMFYQLLFLQLDCMEFFIFFLRVWLCLCIQNIICMISIVVIRMMVIWKQVWVLFESSFEKFSSVVFKVFVSIMLVIMLFYRQGMLCCVLILLFFSQVYRMLIIRSVLMFLCQMMNMICFMKFFFF